MRCTYTALLIILGLSTYAKSEEIAIIKGDHLHIYDQAEATFVDSIVNTAISKSRKTTSPITIKQFDLSDYTTDATFISISDGFKPDLVFAIGSKALSFTQKAGLGNIVFVLVPNPLPPQNAAISQTGIDVAAPPEEWVKATIEKLPGRKKVGLLLPTASGKGREAEIRSILLEKGIDLIVSRVEGPKKVRWALQSLKGKVDVIWLMPEMSILSPEAIEDVMIFGVENTLPVVSFSKKYLKSGAAVSVEADLAAVGSQAAELAIDMLFKVRSPKSGVERPRKIIVSTNPTILDNLRIKLPPTSDSTSGAAK